jgi:hypothetical protein
MKVKEKRPKSERSRSRCEKHVRNNVTQKNVGKYWEGREAVRKQK